MNDTTRRGSPQGLDSYPMPVTGSEYAATPTGRHPAEPFQVFRPEGRRGYRMTFRVGGLTFEGPTLEWDEERARKEAAAAYAEAKAVADRLSPAQFGMFCGLLGSGRLRVRAQRSGRRPPSSMAPGLFALWDKAQLDALTESYACPGPAKP